MIADKLTQMTSRWECRPWAQDSLHTPFGWTITIEGQPDLYICDYLCQDVAEHIVAAHNTWLNDLGELVDKVVEREDGTGRHDTDSDRESSS